MVATWTLAALYASIAAFALGDGSLLRDHALTEMGRAPQGMEPPFRVEHRRLNNAGKGGGAGSQQCDDRIPSAACVEDASTGSGQYGIHTNIGPLWQGILHDTSEHTFPVLYSYAKFLESEKGDTVSLIRAYEEALEKMAGPSEQTLDAMNRLGLLWIDAGRPDVAVRVYDRSLRHHPTSAALYGNMAMAFLKQGLIADAVDMSTVALALEPRNAALHHNAGNIFKEIDLMDNAISHWQNAMALAPTVPQPVLSLASAVGDRGFTDDALHLFAHGIDLATSYFPDERDAARLQHATALLPRVYMSEDEIRVTRAQYMLALTQLLHECPLHLPEPSHTTGCGSMGYYLVYQGFQDKSLRHLLARIYEASAYALTFVAPHVTTHRHHTFAFPLTQRFVAIHTKMQTHTRRIRVGVISAYLFHHSVGLLLQGVLCRLSNETYELILLRYPSPEDDVTRRIQAHASRDILLPTDMKKAQSIVADLALDILVFSEIGMHIHTYFLAFSRLALRTLVFWGHAVTSGIPTVDYFITSTDFESNPRDFTETLSTMTSLTTAFERPHLTLDPSLVPFVDRTRTMYLIPQTLYKLHPVMDAILAAILHGHPESYLVLLQGAVPHLATRIQARLARILSAQTLADRVVFAPFLSTDAFLTLCHLADVVLDPFPLGGGRSSLEIFSVGTPIVVHVARTTVLQLTSAMYKKMNLFDCIATTDEAYVDVALRLGRNATYRMAIAQHIRDHVKVLFEAERVVADWDRCLHSILARPPPPTLFGIRLNLRDEDEAVEIVLEPHESPEQVAASLAATYSLEPLQATYLTTLLKNGRRRDVQPIVLATKLLPRGPPVTFHRGDDVALAIQIHMWRFKLQLSGADVAQAVATAQDTLGHVDGSQEWMAVRRQHVPRHAVAASPQVSTSCKLTVAVTTCKRLALFLESLASVQPYLKTLDAIICMILVIDDHSSASDRATMEAKAATSGLKVEFAYTRRKGHAHSLNTLMYLVAARYLLYLEDDWRWHPSLPRHPIEHALTILQASHDVEFPLVQVQLNAQPQSGWYVPGHDYWLHEFGIVHHRFGYWPGFSLNPAVWDLTRLRQCHKRFNESSDIFEREFSLAIWRCGLHVAFLPYATADHIGAPPGSNASAYVLNGMPRRFDVQEMKGST
ncbi:Aste57867_13452 [Aphanomyces stellatus]|uniref:protein O-GlcNAc transferase n=1 Tax=Aphanomyces stellatus TaxID=120398 RepID=A0A485KYH4_9STRA|nr:hypothetical protein As57867_013402 [Aphanomyces stellatus]VFT90290.1 Aste57867_13452 [Aphanomyces stellatus]